MSETRDLNKEVGQAVDNYNLYRMADFDGVADVAGGGMQFGTIDKPGQDNYFRSRSILGDTSLVTRMIKDGSYYQLDNLIRWDAIPWNSTAKELRSNFVAEAELYLKRTNAEGQDERLSGSPEIMRVLRQIEELLAQIEVHLCIVNRAILYYDSTAKQFELVPYHKFSVSSSGDKYGTWSRKDERTGKERGVDLTRDNTVIIRRASLLAPQAKALNACILLSTIDNAINVTMRTKSMGSRKVLAVPADQAKVDKLNNHFEQTAGITNNKGLHAIGTSKGKSSEIKVLDLGSEDDKLPWQTGREAAQRDIASSYEAPHQLLGDTSGLTYNNVEQFRQIFYTGTIRNEWKLIVNALSSALPNILTGFPDGAVVEFDHPSLAGGLSTADLISNINNIRDITSINERREMVGLSPVDGGEDVPGTSTEAPDIEPVESTEEEQEDFNERLISYEKRSVADAEIIDNELYLLNEKYDTDIDVERLSRATRYTARESETDIVKLVRLVHLDYYATNGLREFSRVVHSGEMICDSDCSKRSAKTEKLETLVDGCRCLIYPTTKKAV